MPSQAARIASNALGAMILTFFGGAWLVLACLNLFGAQVSLVPALGLPAALLLGVGVQRYRRHGAALREWLARPEAKPVGRVLRRTNTGQWVLIAIVATALGIAGQQAWILPAIILIVGLHFLPLARALYCPVYYLTAAGLVATALVYPMVCADGPQSPLGAAIAGLILWITALVRLLEPTPVSLHAA